MTITLCLSAGALLPAHGEWNLVWSDEFNGTSLNTNIWYIDNGNCGGWGFGELQYYTPGNVYVANGSLHIVAKNQPTNGFRFTSGRINSSGTDQCTTPDVVPVMPNSYAKKFGRFEFRARLPSGTGFWPQIWMYPQNTPYVSWPNCGEIDVLENDGMTPNAVNGAIHFNDGSFYAWCPANDITQWHTYAVEWDTNSISWITDGTTNATATDWAPPPGYSFPAPFDWPFYFVINLAIGGDYTGNPSAPEIATNLPAELQLDYIRVYDQTAPMKLSFSLTKGFLLLAWPTNIICHLQSRTEQQNGASGSNWVDVVGAVNPYRVAPKASRAFFRLVSP